MWMTMVVRAWATSAVSVVTFRNRETREKPFNPFVPDGLDLKSSDKSISNRSAVWLAFLLFCSVWSVATVFAYVPFMEK